MRRNCWRAPKHMRRPVLPSRSNRSGLVGKPRSDVVTTGRSHHNSTIEGIDIPPTHRTNTFIAVAAAFHRQQFHAELWGADHQSAYRQLPMAEPDHPHSRHRESRGDGHFGNTGACCSGAQHPYMGIHTHSRHARVVAQGLDILTNVALRG